MMCIISVKNCAFTIASQSKYQHCMSLYKTCTVNIFWWGTGGKKKTAMTRALARVLKLPVIFKSACPKGPKIVKIVQIGHFYLWKMEVTCQNDKYDGWPWVLYLRPWPWPKQILSNSKFWEKNTFNFLIRMHIFSEEAQSKISSHDQNKFWAILLQRSTCERKTQ